MKDRLIIRVKSSLADKSELVSWVLFDQANTVLHADEMPLAQLYHYALTLSDEFAITLVVPSETVLLTSASIPSKQLRQIKQALPYMVEEQLADTIEDVHLAIPASFDKTRDDVPIAVVRHNLLINWLEALHEANLSPTEIVTETLCVPRHLHACNLFFDGDNIIYRTGVFSGSVFSLSQLNSLFDQLDKESHFTAVAVVTTGNNSADIANAKGFIQHISEHHTHIHDIHESHFHEECTEVLATTLLGEQERAINLLQGGYTVSKSRGGDSATAAWQKFAQVASIGLAVYLVLAIGSGIYFNNQADAVQKKSYALYKQIFPTQKRIVSPRKQMESYLRQNSRSGSGAEFLRLLADSARPLGTSNNNVNYTVNQLRYNAQGNDLQLEVQSESLENLDALKRALLEKGLAVEINSATEKDDFIIGKIKVREL